MTVRVRSTWWQVAGVFVAFAAVAAWNRQTDGLWFQGDAPRHAVNGLFWADLLRAWPRDPFGYALSYYARYPVIAPATYPPLFYVLEGLVFLVGGPSPYFARLLVLSFAITAGLYTMAWNRRWIAPAAGWAGAFLAFLPGMVLWSNAVMLNTPALALGLAALYHFRRWQESPTGKQLVLWVAFVVCTLLTYYPAGSVVMVLAAWTMIWRPHIRFGRQTLWAALATAIGLAPLIAALTLARVHTERHLPTMALLARVDTWTYYWKALPDLVGWPAVVLGVLGCSIGWVSRLRETTLLVVWVVALIGVLSVVPARDPRYLLLAGPALITAAAIGITWAFRAVPADAAVPSTLLVAALVGAFSWAVRRPVPDVRGFREVAVFLRERAAQDGVVYDGEFDGVLGFYMRAFDPDFTQRLVRADQLLYRYGPTTSFEWRQHSNVASPDEVIALLRARSGCPWVAIEVSAGPVFPRGSQLLRQAVLDPSFSLVRSFRITGAGDRRVDLYRLTGDVQPVNSVDLSFPSLTTRVFHGVVPVTR
jgi:hypothetical protein